MKVHACRNARWMWIGALVMLMGVEGVASGGASGALPDLAGGDMARLLSSGAVSQRASMIPALRAGEWNTLFETDGPGMITHIWFTFPSGDKLLGRRNLLRIFWDGEKDPSVEAPLSDFFGVPFGFTGAEFRISSKYLVVAPTNALNCYFPMPFARHARIEIFPEQIESGGGFYCQVDYCKFPKQLPEEWQKLRFHAQFRFENPCETYGRNYLFLDAVGRGVLVGATFGIEDSEPQPDAWFHGGGDSIFIDGESAPYVLHGVGGEDFFSQSFGVAPFLSDRIGTPMQEGKRRVLYRFFVDDPIVFRSSIRAVLGALGNNYSSVAYWYQEEPHRRFFRTPSADARMPNSIAKYGAYDIEPAEPTEWKLLAPFKIDNENPFGKGRAFEVKETGNEGYTYHVEGETPSLPGGDNMAVTWTPQMVYHSFVDFNVMARPAVLCIRLQRGVVGYALRYVDCARDKIVSAHVGFDDEVGVRVNDEVVFGSKHEKGFAEEAFKVRLRKGRNRILVKLSNDDNTDFRLWAFSFRIEDLSQ